MSQTTDPDTTRTLGSLTAADIGKTITITDGPTTTSGVLAHVRHHLGDTSMRRATTVELVYRRSDETTASVQNHHGHAPHGDKRTFPDRSDCQITVSETAR